MLTIALTGNIGSGKSTVAELFAAQAVPVVDTDLLAREAVLPGTEALAKIVAHFGQGILFQDGQLNRNEVKEKIFSFPEEKLWLENLLHPLILERAKAQLSTLTAAYAIYVVPLLVGREPTDFIQRILVVDAPPELQAQRVITRDQIPPTTFAAILATQANRDALLLAADDIIVNDASLESLKQQVLILHKKYLSLSKT